MILSVPIPCFGCSHRLESAVYHGICIKRSGYTFMGGNSVIFFFTSILNRSLSFNPIALRRAKTPCFNPIALRRAKTPCFNPIALRMAKTHGVLAVLSATGLRKESDPRVANSFHFGRARSSREHTGNHKSCRTI